LEEAQGVCLMDEPTEKKKPVSKGTNVRMPLDVVDLLRKLSAFSKEEMGEIAGNILRPALKERLRLTLEYEAASIKAEQAIDDNTKYFNEQPVGGKPRKKK
jgi:hypothetical protein